MRKFRVLMLALSLLLPLLIVSVALAQDEDNDDDGDAAHPIVKMLAYYFDEEEDTLEDYHDEGIGFGVLVKLYAIAAENDDVDADELVEAYLDGMTLREMYEEYGKPAVRGVGHVRWLPVDPDDEDAPSFLPPGQGGTPPGLGGMPPGQAKKWADPWRGGRGPIIPLPTPPDQ